jgi:imidazole glycerol-phosphate synthase subunit HisF
MLIPRVIPILLMKGLGLVKTIRFKNPIYVGDPINAVKIFNEKEVDELTILNISATPEGQLPPLQAISKIASECFMPLCYGGGIRDLITMERILNLGVEKVALNTSAAERPKLITESAKIFGSQSVVVSIDVRRILFGRYEVMTRGATCNLKQDPVAYAKRMEELGAGELLITSVDRDGTQQGYDLELLQRVSAAVGVPVVAAGGASSVADLTRAIRLGGASAAAAGSLFVFQGKHRAVLITYPERAVLEEAFAP